MQCECGPQNLRGKQPTVQGKQAGTRVKRSEMGLSVRVGCPVHFGFKTLPAAPSIMELRYYASHHLNHGKAAQVSLLDFPLICVLEVDVAHHLQALLWDSLS